MVLFASFIGCVACIFFGLFIMAREEGWLGVFGGLLALFTLFPFAAVLILIGSGARF